MAPFYFPFLFLGLLVILPCNLCIQINYLRFVMFEYFIKLVIFVYFVKLQQIPQNLTNLTNLQLFINYRSTTRKTLYCVFPNNIDTLCRFKGQYSLFHQSIIFALGGSDSTQGPFGKSHRYTYAELPHPQSDRFSS